MVDLLNIETRRLLSIALLKRDFNLNINLPEDKEPPCVELRLNCILWIEDILNVIRGDDIKNEVRGIDFPTGASCIISLLCSKQFKWNMFAVDCDSENITYAKQNLLSNNLNNRIKGNNINIF